MIEGGITLIEERGLQELALGARARQLKVRAGNALTPDEVETFGFCYGAGVVISGGIIERETP